MEVLDLFPSTVGILEIEDISHFKEPLFDKNIQPKSADFISKFAHVSESKNVLDDFPELQEIIMKNFNAFKNDALKLNNTEFEITTSWAVKIEKDGHGKPHQHRNAAYSAVLYFDDLEDKGGELAFSAIGVKPTSFFLMPSEVNTRTSERILVQPGKNKMIVFPSHLFHTVCLYTGEEPRHSLAVNLFPKGMNGMGDSTMWTEQRR